MKSNHFRIYVLLLSCLLFCSIFTTNILAEQVSWTWRILDESHKDITFSVYDVDKAQNANIVIKNRNDETEKYVEPFSITNATQQIKISLSENNYIKSDQTYDAYIEDENGNTTNSESICLSTHNNFFRNNYYYEQSIHAYPIGAIIVDAEKNLDITAGEKITAEVGFDEYEGKLEDGDLIFSYPKQEIGTVVKFVWKDSYGCSCSTTREVKNRDCNYYSEISVYRDGVYAYSSLPSDQRLCAIVGGNTYYSPYGMSSNGYTQKYITFPSIVPNNLSEIQVYVESIYGSSSTPKNYSILNGNIGLSVDAYPSMAKGYISTDRMDHSIKSISTTINGIIYTGTIDKNNYYVIKYAKQPENSTLHLEIVDDAGCTKGYDATISSEKLNFGYGYSPDIFANHFNARVESKRTLHVSISGKEYSQTNKTDESQTLTISYENQISGTKGYYWIEAEDGRETEKEEFTIPQRTYIVDLYAEVTYMEGLVSLDLSKTQSLPDNEPTAYVLIGNEKYPVTLSKPTEDNLRFLWSYDDDDIEYMDEDTNIYYFKISYPRKKIGDSFQVVVNDNDGYSYVLNEKFKDLNIEVDIDTVTSESQKITGWGDANSEVSITIGKKKYKCKANKNGYFSKKVKPQKVGTKITVSVKSPDGYKGSAKSKIVKPNKKVKFKSNVYVSNKDIFFSVTNGRKGDKIEFVINGNKYTTKLTSNKKIQTLKLSLDNELIAGAKATVSIKDRFGTVCYKQNKIVYAASSIYVGMRENEVNYTTYGKPIEKNDYGSFKQWIFKKGNTTYYVYIENGVVIEIQKMNY